MAQGLRLIGLVAFATMVFLTAPARTADHKDAPGINEDGRADLLDVFAFVNPENGNVVLAQTVNPFTIGGATGVAFGADVLYEFKIDNDGDNVEDLVIQATFTPAVPAPQRFSVRGPVKPRVSGVASSLLVADAPAISGIADGTVAELQERTGEPSLERVFNKLTATENLLARAEQFARELAAERLLGRPIITFKSDAMTDGTERVAARTGRVD